VLSGDIDGNDLTDGSGVVTHTDNIRGSNAYHVVTAGGVTETAVLDGFTITGGSADGSDPHNAGGGVSSEAGSPTLRRLVLSGNAAVTGGGLHVTDGSPSLSYVVFRRNTAVGYGGGLRSLLASPKLVNVIFEGNRAGHGGGLFCESSSCSVVNGVFYGNSAISDGGGMVSLVDADTSLVNVTFSVNTAPLAGAVHNVGSTLVVRNGVLWGNSVGEVVYSGGILTIAHSLVEGGCPVGAICTEIVNDDPMLVDATVGNLRLGTDSPAIDAGDSGVLPGDSVDLDGDGDTAEPIPVDLDSIWRVVNDVVDMGAYERPVLVAVPLSLRAFP
jgi:hypothetical protein